MPRPEVLERIQSVEEEADELVALAEKDRDERIAEARERAEEIRSQAREDARELTEQRLEEARAEIDEECAQLLEAGEGEREALAERARKRVEEVTDSVVELFKEDAHAQT